MATESSGSAGSNAAINEFDPLGLQTPDETARLIKKQVVNLLRSYNGWWDIFAELIQNSMDAVYQRFASTSGQEYSPRITITIDMSRPESNRVRVSDNGIGMDREGLQNLFKPNYTSKYETVNGIGLRGHKGVGATYLAYGFNYIAVQSKKDEQHHAVEMVNGRQWCEEQQIVKPTVNSIDLFDDGLIDESSGTSIEIRLSGVGQNPKNFQHVSLKTAKNWLDALTVRTAIGQVKLTNNAGIPRAFQPLVTLHFQDSLQSEVSTETKLAPEYCYPHEFDVFGRDVHNVTHNDETVKQISDIKVAPRDGLTADQFRANNRELFGLECIWDIWDAEQLIDTEDRIIHSGLPRIQDTMEDPESVIATIRRNNITVYGAFVDSVARFATLNASFGGREGYPFMKPGIQLATSTMPQGEVYEIDLRRNIGYNRQIHILIHADNVEPDLGRKNFQKEHVDLCLIIGARIAETMIEYRRHLKDSRGNDAPYDGTTRQDALTMWATRKAQYPLLFAEVPSLTVPQEEQDVVALYNQLLGSQDIKGVKLLASSINGRYDAGIENTISSEYVRNDSSMKLGVGRESIDLSERSPQMQSVAEFKYLLSYIWEDFRKGVKHPRDIDVLICWELGDNPENIYEDPFNLQNWLPPIGDGLSRYRKHYGSTHNVVIGSDSFEVICLKDLLTVISTPLAGSIV